MARKGKAGRMIALIMSKTFIVSLLAAVFAGGLACFLKMVDTNYPDMDILAKYNPNKTVFNVFIVFCGLITATRTGHALARYLDAASIMNKQSSCWYKSCGTLVAFTRSSDAPKQEISKFNNTAVRLYSLLSALCLEGMENKGDRLSDVQGTNLNLIGWHDLSPAIREGVAQSINKSEYVHQMLDNIIVDGMRKKLVTMAPPLMGKVFGDLGAGLNLFHEAKKYSVVPLPLPYVVITRCLLCAEATFVPFILATLTSGYMSSFLFTFGGTFLLWFLNMVAEKLCNPFHQYAYTLDVAGVQSETNEKLLQILRSADVVTPSLSDDFVVDSETTKESSPQRDSVKKVKKAS